MTTFNNTRTRNCPCCGETNGMRWYNGFGGSREEPAEEAGYECRGCGQWIHDFTPEPDPLPEWSYCSVCGEYGVAVWQWELDAWELRCNLCGGEVWDEPDDALMGVGEYE